MEINEVQLSYKHKVKQSEMPIIVSSEGCYKVLTKLYNENTIQHLEQSYILLLNRANRLLGTFKVGEGGISQIVIDIKLILQSIILSNASCVILSHNHPSGNPNPSVSDVEITKKLRIACDIIDIQLLDHMIITSEGYYSFTDNQNES